MIPIQAALLQQHKPAARRMKVYATVLFGDDERYTRYLGAWIRAALNLFPRNEDWYLYLAADAVAYEKHAKLFERLAEFVRVGPFLPLPRCKAMLQRMSCVFDRIAPVDYVFCRDLDSPPMPRDRACCDQFIASKRTVHTIHDSDQHIGIMGGLCGFWTPKFRERTGLRSLDDLYASANLTAMQWETHGADQFTLNQLCLRKGGPSLLEHRYAGWYNGPGTKPARGSCLYACESASMPVSDVGIWRRESAKVWPGSLINSADRLGAHLGCSHYDHEAAIRFWDEHGDPAIAKAVAACERP